MSIVNRIQSGDAIARWLSYGFDSNSSMQAPYVMLRADHAEELPDDVMAWAERTQRGPTQAPTFSLPAGILAKHYLGEKIPEYTP